MIFLADCRETSCSADRPPNSIPTRIFPGIVLSLTLPKRLIRVDEKSLEQSRCSRSKSGDGMCAEPNPVIVDLKSRDLRDALRHTAIEATPFGEKDENE